jgi:ribosomal-protein-alanine N-acetyltransferase
MSAVLNDPFITLRPMTMDDLPKVMAIERNAYQFPWSEGIFRDCLHVGYCCWLIEKGGQVRGYGVMSVAAGEAHILNLCVQPAFQNQGLGGRVLRKLIDVARQHKAQTVFLEVRPSNEPAIRLYSGAGFNEIGMRKSYYPGKNGREDAMILALQL